MLYAGGSPNSPAKLKPVRSRAAFPIVVSAVVLAFGWTTSTLAQDTNAVVSAKKPKPGVSFSARFNQVDTNKDGVVSKAEFKGKPELFDVVDADKNGFLTRVELASFAKSRTKVTASGESKVLPRAGS